MATNKPNPRDFGDPIMLAFLDAYDAEMKIENWGIRLAETEAGRRYLAKIASETGTRFENLTREEMEANKHITATAAGVSAAIRFAFAAVRKASKDKPAT